MDAKDITSVAPRSERYNVTRIVERSENKGNIKFTCNFCKATYTESYFRVKANLLQISEHGVKVCIKVTNEKVTMKKLQYETEARAKTIVSK
jgi:SHS2 domain-containing protein